MHSARDRAGLAPTVLGWGRTGRAIGLTVLSVVRETESLVITKDASRLSNDHGGQARTPAGLDWSCRHPIPCCRGRGTVSAGWRVSAGRTPAFPDWVRRLSYRIHDPGGHKSVESGVKVDAIHARPQNALRSGVRTRRFASRQRRERRDSLAGLASEGERSEPSKKASGRSVATTREIARRDRRERLGATERGATRPVR